MTDNDKSKQNPPAKTASWGTGDPGIKQTVTNTYTPKEFVVDLKKQKSK